MAVCSALPLAAADDSAGKSKYHLFNPTPEEFMRELSTDRPDKTESPYTVDAGHVQIEMDFFNYAYDRHNVERANTQVETYGVAPVNLKLGLLNNVDLQLILEPYTRVRTRDRSAGGVLRQDGFGDVTLRSKINLWGNDGGATALALMPVLKIPANQDDLGNDSIEGGLIVPLAVELPYGWGMGLMTEVDFVRDAEDQGYDPEFVNTIAFGRDIIGNLGGYVEFFSLVNPNHAEEWEGTFDFGFTYGFTKDIQLDLGLNIGLTRSAEDWNPFIGLSWRF